jgi:hypothetical protein
MTSFALRRVLPIVGGALCCVAGLLAWTALQPGGVAFARGADVPLEPASADAERIVVAELFTSDGCSSCPPADELFSRLVREAVGGTIVVGLDEHVDYWDRLGWRDPFSSAAFSRRQSEYDDQVFHTGNIYTPQLVIDGQFDALGSDLAAVRRAIAKASAAPKATVGIVVSQPDIRHVRVRVDVEVPPSLMLRGRADVVVALTQDRLSDDVRAGENRGRHLAHTAVVRSLTTIGSIDPPARAFDMTSLTPLGSDWKLDDMKVVGFVQERRSRRVVGAGAAAIAPRPAKSVTE